jgi:INO80 complex subunit C
LTVAQSLVEQFSYVNEYRPFKNPEYRKNHNRRAKNLKTVLTQERERERAEREKKRAEKQVGTAMDVDGDTGVEEEEIPTCTFSPSCSVCNC